MIKTVFRCLDTNTENKFTSLDPIDLTDFIDLVKQSGVKINNRKYKYKSSYLDLDEKEFVFEVE
jgi:hypothetical protein